MLAKTEKAYHYYWELIRDKKINDYARLGFRSDIDEVLSLYMDKETLKAKTEGEKEFFLFPGFKIKPMENYRMKIYGNGKWYAWNRQMRIENFGKDLQYGEKLRVNMKNQIYIFTNYTSISQKIKTLLGFCIKVPGLTITFIFNFTACG